MANPQYGQPESVERWRDLVDFFVKLNGGDDNAVEYALAVMYFESGGSADAFNINRGENVSYDYGLFQVNSGSRWWEQEARKFYATKGIELPTNRDFSNDVIVNIATAMYMALGPTGQHWGHWVVTWGPERGAGQQPLYGVAPGSWLGLNPSTGRYTTLQGQTVGPRIESFASQGSGSGLFFGFTGPDGFRFDMPWNDYRKLMYQESPVGQGLSNVADQSRTRSKAQLAALMSGIADAQAAKMKPAMSGAQAVGKIAAGQTPPTGTQAIAEQLDETLTMPETGDDTSVTAGIGSSPDIQGMQMPDPMQPAPLEPETPSSGYGFHPLGNQFIPDAGDSLFGAPRDGGARQHQGVDMPGQIGDAIYSVADGTVVYAGPLNDSAGRVVVVDHGNGWTTHYFHTSAEHVVKDQKVQGGFRIADVGATGNAAGPHLHFELRHNGVPVDPLEWLRRLLGVEASPSPPPAATVNPMAQAASMGSGGGEVMV